MGKKDDNWKKIFNYFGDNSKQFRQWLKDDSGIVFEIPNSIFTNMNFKPVKMIPHYHRNELPYIFKQNNIEIFRHKSGSCLLVKRDAIENSIFPYLPEPKIIAKFVKELSVKESLLFRNEILNEENYFFLFLRLQMLQIYIEEELGICVSSELENCGRFQGNVTGKIKIADKVIDIEKANYECDHVLENDDLIVLLELKQKFYKTQSLHQLILPYLKMTQEYKIKNKKIILIYFETNISNTTNNSGEKYLFRLYHQSISIEDGLVRLDKCSFENGVEYRITLCNKS